MAYAEGNPGTKKMLKEWVASGKKVYIFSYGPFACKENGTEGVEGPHYPKPHNWYAQVTVVDGIITKVK